MERPHFDRMERDNYNRRINREVMQLYLEDRGYSWEELEKMEDSLLLMNFKVAKGNG